MAQAARASLSLKASPVGRFPACVAQGSLVGAWDRHTVRHLSLQREQVPKDVGDYLRAQGMYSRGGDFTSEDAKTPGYVGNSTLRLLWSGKEGSYCQGFDTVELYLLLGKGRPAGVIAWVRPTDLVMQWFDKRPDHPRHHPQWRVPVARVGNLMAFLAPQARGQGLCDRMLRELVLPDVERLARQAKDQGAIPLVGAADAMHTLVRERCSIPLSEYLGPCGAMVNDLWSTLERQRMMPERRVREARWLVPRQPCPKPKPRLRA